MAVIRTFVAEARPAGTLAAHDLSGAVGGAFELCRTWEINPGMLKRMIRTGGSKESLR